MPRERDWARTSIWRYLAIRITPRLPGHLVPVGGVFYLITSINLSSFLWVLLFKNITISLLPAPACCDEEFHHLISHHGKSQVCLFETCSSAACCCTWSTEKKDQQCLEVLRASAPLPSTGHTVLVEYMMSPPSPGAAVQLQGPDTALAFPHPYRNPCLKANDSSTHCLRLLHI